MENVYILFLSIESLLSFFERDFMRPKCVDGQDEERGGGSSRPFVSTVCGRVDERERERSERTVGGRVGQTGHGYATDGVVRGQKPDIADRSTRSAPLTGILVT